MKHLIIISIYNKPVLTNRCLASLADTVDLSKNILCLVDDASGQPTRQVIDRFLKSHQGVELIRNKYNQGKPKCINLALRKFSDCDYFSIIDNDVIVKTKHWPEKLISAHKDWNNQAILGAYTYMSGYPFNKKGMHYLDPWPFWNLAGCFFSFSKLIFRKVGYFFDCSRRSEDADYCRRAYLAGFRWYYLTDIKAGISGYKPYPEQKRLKLFAVREQEIRKRWSDYVMKTHKYYFPPR